MNVGQFKQWVIDNDIPDGTPLWKPQLTEQGGCLYPTGWGGDIDNVEITTEVFGIALPPERQRHETGVMLW